MKRIFKLFLCLLMLFSFTNITRALDEEGEYVSAKAVAENYKKTNFIEALLKEARRENPKADISVVVDEEKHEIRLVSEDEEPMIFTYNDEYISLLGEAPTSLETFDLGLYIAQVMYSQNMVYALLDTMGYNNYDVEITGENDEEIEPDMAFYNEYGFYMKSETVNFGDENNTCDEESEECVQYSGSATYLQEIRISLNKAKIAHLVETYGVERADFLKLIEAQKPVVTVKKKGSASQVSWDQDFNAKTYGIFRSDKKDGSFKKIATVNQPDEIDGSKLTYKDKKVTYGKTYYYKVKAYGYENNATSDVVKFKMVPGKVNNVRLTSIKTDSIKVNFDKQNESGYVVERSTDGKKWTTVKTITKASTLSYTDSKLSANKRYYYRVKAYKKVGSKKVYGTYSDVVSAKTAPAKPKLSIKVNSWDSFEIKATEVKGATKYVFTRATKKDGEYTRIAELGGTTFNDEGLTYGTTYYYKVKACNSDNKCSGYSSYVSKKAELQKPGLSLETSKDIPMTIRVSKIANVDGFEVYRATKEKGDYKKIATVTNTPSYMDMTAKKGTTYYYKVKSFVTINGSVKRSGYSDIKYKKAAYQAPAEPSVPEVQSFVTTNPSELNGAYGYGEYILRIYAITNEKIVVNLDPGGMGADFLVTLVDGKLVNEEEGVTIEFTTERNELYATVSGFGDSELNGKYHRTAQMDLDDFYQIFMGQEEFLQTKYNGKFVNGDNVVYMYQVDEVNVRVKGTIDGQAVSFAIEIREDEGLRIDGMNGSYTGDVVDNLLTLKHVNNDTTVFDVTLYSDDGITKQQVAEIFYE